MDEAADCHCEHHFSSSSSTCNCQFHEEEREYVSPTCTCEFHQQCEDSSSSACSCDFHHSQSYAESSCYDFSADESDLSNNERKGEACPQVQYSATETSLLAAHQPSTEDVNVFIGCRNITSDLTLPEFELVPSHCSTFNQGNQHGTEDNSLSSQEDCDNSGDGYSTSSDSSRPKSKDMRYAFLEQEESVDSLGETTPSTSSNSSFNWLSDGGDDPGDDGSDSSGDGDESGGDHDQDPDDEDPGDDDPGDEPAGDGGPDPNTSSSSDSDAGNENFSLENPLLDRLFTSAENRTAREILALVLALSLKQNWDYKSLVGICRIFNVTSNIEVLPGTKEQLWSLLKKKAAGIQRHGYCSACHNYLGRMSTLPRIVVCGECDTRKSRKQIKYFITVSIRKQLTRLLSVPGIWEFLQYRNRRQKLNPDAIEDIFDGEAFQALEEKEDGYRQPYDFTYLLNNDGFSVSKSSNTEAHPIFFKINEFDPSIRQKMTLLAGVWLDDEEPNFNLFFEAFVTEGNSLSQEGIRWVPHGDEEVVSRFFPTAFCADAKARAAVMNFSKHSGKYSCPFCEHPGVFLRGMKFPLPGTQVIIPQPNGDQRVVLIPEVIPLRTDAGIRIEMQEATLQGRRIHGIKGVSVMMNLNHFDLSYGCSPDDLHPVYLGVTKFLTNLIIDAANDQDAFLRGIDGRLKSIRTPTLMSRKPRSITKRAKWKGTEWRNWLLYFAVVCLHDHHNDPVPHGVIEIFALLSKAIFLLSQDSISDADVNEAERCLLQFVTRFQNQYGSVNMRFNVHILLHLPAAVRKWGGLQVHSTFPFESLNGKYKKFIKSPNGAINQIVDRYLLSSLVHLLSLHPDLDDEVVEELQFILTGNKIANPERVGNVYLFDVVHDNRAPTPEERQLLLDEHIECVQLAEYQQCQRSKVLFRVESYYDREETKSNNSLIYTTQDEFFVTDSIVSFVQGNNVICGMFCRKVEVDILLFGVPHIMRVVNTNLRKFVPMSVVRGLAMKMQVRNRFFISPMCNHGEID